MAAPHVTGALAMIKTLQPSLNNAQLRATLLNSVEAIPALNGMTVTGGLLNLANAVNYQAPPVAENGTVELSVNSSANDAEESVANGDIYLDSSDLEFGYDSYVGANQLVGVRFTNVSIPQGSVINSANVAFTVDEISSETTQVQISVENSANALGFTSQNYNISARSLSNNSVPWYISAWSNVGSKQQTPDLIDLVQGVVNRADWQAGNSIVFIFEGTGLRTAEAYDGVATAAPSLTISYSKPGEEPVNIAPTAEFNTNVSEGTTPLNVQFTDMSSDPDGSIINWYWDFGDGATANVQHPSHTYTSDGTYTVTLTVTDNEQATDQSTMVINSNSEPEPELQVPNAPSNLNISIEKSGKGKTAVTTAMYLHWQDNADNEESFVIERCLEIVEGKGKNATRTCNYTTYLMVAANTTATEIDIVSGYNFRMKAVNSIGDSPYSASVQSR